MKTWHGRLWAQDEPTGLSWLALRTALAPAEWLFRAAVGTRSWAYERGMLRSTAPPIPTFCVGNLTVGGTGKTPLTAWLASELLGRGGSPAIVMRGYGADELDVHRLLNRQVGVYAAPDRLDGVQRAAADGFDCAVLDDGFQHRAIRATVDLVLVAAEEWTERTRLLPRGPWREPPGALRRATLVAVTRKVASEERSAVVARRIAEIAPEVPVARCHIGLVSFARLRGASPTLDETAPLNGLDCATGVAGVAHPEIVWRQLEAAGARIEQRRAFPDHHRYSEADIEHLVQRAARGPLLATLKDAVKLIKLLPAAVELCVPLQEVSWESGADVLAGIIEASLDRATAGR